MTPELQAAVESLEFDVAKQGQLYYLLPDYKTRIKLVCQALRAAEQGRRQVESEVVQLVIKARSLERLVRRWKREAILLRLEVADTNLRYYDLLMAVASKHEGETRHQTAKRYICEAENNATTGTARQVPNGDLSHGAGSGSQQYNAPTSALLAPRKG